MRTLLLGIVLLVILGVGGVVYRNALEHPSEPITCPLDAEVCPDGTSLGRTGSACAFPACPPPNVSLPAAGIAYALPDGFASVAPSSPSVLAEYATALAASSSVSSAEILIRRYPRAGTTTPLAVIETTALAAPSGLPVPTTSDASLSLGAHQFTVVPIERSEGVVDTAYYLSFGAAVLRFDAIDRGADWTNPALDTSALPGARALRALLGSLQGAS